LLAWLVIVQRRFVTMFYQVCRALRPLLFLTTFSPSYLVRPPSVRYVDLYPLYCEFYFLLKPPWIIPPLGSIQPVVRRFPPPRRVPPSVANPTCFPLWSPLHLRYFPFFSVFTASRTLSRSRFFRIPRSRRLDLICIIHFLYAHRVLYLFCVTYLISLLGSIKQSPFFPTPPSHPVTMECV